MNKDDEIREELSDLWCKEITGQLKGSEKIRLQNLIEEREFPFPDRKRWLSRLRQKEELPQRQPFCCLWGLDWFGVIGNSYSLSPR